MGDRANIYLVDTNSERCGIYLYTHWDGTEWPERLCKALIVARPVWNDPEYCARIIVREVFSDYDGLKGGGISTRLGDNEHPIIVCDLPLQIVAYAHEGQERDGETWYGALTFADYVAQETARYPS